MKKLLAPIMFAFASFTTFSQSAYKGLERMCWTNNKGKIECYDSPRKWYHLNTAIIDNDSIFIYKEPVRIEKKDTIYSAADGAFYYYFGRLQNSDTRLILCLMDCRKIAGNLLNKNSAAATRKTC